jgi:hypothetical protein
MDLKIFRINDCEWWCGYETPESMLKAYMEITGLSHEDATGDEDALPVELSQDQVNHYRYHLESGDTVTFAEELQIMLEAGETFPCFFATTEW